MEIITFTRDKENLSCPVRDGLIFRHVVFNSSKLEDLMLVAKYKIVSYPTSIILDSKGHLLLKVRGTIPDTYIDKFINT